MKAIVVGTDGSAQADSAVIIAADMARIYAIPLAIIHVYERRWKSDPEPGSDLTDPIESARFKPPVFELVPPSLNLGETQAHYDLEATLSDEAHGYALLEQALRTAETAGAKNVGLALRSGDPASEIMTLARNVGADLIVLGRRGMNPVARSLIGGVSDKVLRHAEVNVLLVTDSINARSQ